MKKLLLVILTLPVFSTLYSQKSAEFRMASHSIIGTSEDKVAWNLPINIGEYTSGFVSDNSLDDEGWQKLVKTITNGMLSTGKGMDFHWFQPSSSVQISKLSGDEEFQDYWEKEAAGNYVWRGTFYDLEERFGENWMKNKKSQYYVEDGVMKWVYMNVEIRDSIFGYDEYGPLYTTPDYPNGLQILDTTYETRPFDQVGIRNVGLWDFSKKGELTITPEIIQFYRLDSTRKEPHYQAMMLPSVVMPGKEGSDPLISDVETTSYIFDSDMNETPAENMTQTGAHTIYQHEVGPFMSALLKQVRSGDLRVVPVKAEMNGGNDFLAESERQFYTGEIEYLDPGEGIRRLTTIETIGAPRDSIIGYDQYGAVYAQDEFGNPIELIDTSYFPVYLSQLVGFRTLENWYIDREKGGLTRVVTAITPVYAEKSGRQNAKVHIPKVAIILNNPRSKRVQAKF